VLYDADFATSGRVTSFRVWIDKDNNGRYDENSNEAPKPQNPKTPKPLFN